MSGEDRREFLKKLAKGAAYSAPVVYSMAAPLDLVGQGMKPSGKGKDMEMKIPPGQETMLSTSPFPPPPGGG